MWLSSRDEAMMDSPVCQGTHSLEGQKKVQKDLEATITKTKRNHCFYVLSSEKCVEKMFVEIDIYTSIFLQEATL